MNTDEARRRAEALFKKGQQSHEAQAMAEHQAELQATREKTERLRALRLARDATNEKKSSNGTVRPTRRPAPVQSAPQSTGHRSRVY